MFRSTLRNSLPWLAVSLVLAAPQLVAPGPASAASGATTYSAAQANDMKFGYTARATGGRSTAQAIDHQVQLYGAGVVRQYYNRFPAPWKTINSQSNGLPMFLSFKVPVSAVNKGKYDAQLRAWFKAAPRDRKTWWSYMPEPEDDIQNGAYSSAAFRSAFARIAKLSRSADNQRLVSTLTLMAYTVGSCGNGSRRNPSDYWPGSAAVDLIAFDCSNASWKVHRYPAPSDMLGKADAYAARMGKPWGLGEIESRRLSGDDGTHRAQWLNAVSKYVTANNAKFACYFDVFNQVDFRLTDTKSKAAWRSIVTKGN